MIPTRACWIFAALSLSLASAAAAAEPTLLTFDGPAVAAKWIGLDAEGRHQFQEEHQVRVLPAADFQRWGARADLATGSQVVVLADGGILAARRVRLVGGDLLIQSELWGEPPNVTLPAVVRLPAEQARGIVLRLPGGLAERDKLLDRVAMAKVDDDRILLANGDFVAGMLVVASPPGAPPPGAAGPPAAPIDDAKLLAEDAPLWLETKADGKTERIKIPLSSVAAVVFNPALIVFKNPRGAAFWIGFRDGSALLAESLHLAGDAPRVVRSGGGSLPLNPYLELKDEVVAIRPVSPRVTYLSDLTPAGYRHWPFLAANWNYQLDHNVLGGWLRQDSAVWEKGIGVHSRSRLLFDVPTDAKRFQAELALDDAAGPGGSVQFRVLLLPAMGEWKTVYESPPVRGGQPAIPLSLEVTGARQIALIVEFGERADQLDYANWLGARFVK